MVKLEERGFVLMPRGQEPFRDESGRITSSGALGVVGIESVYLRAYGERPKGSCEYEALDVDEVVRGVVFRLSGSRGEYDVWRVR